VTAIPCAENSVDSKSFLPSDVIQSYSGASIEIIDTDAEGRLVADGLSYLIKITSQNILRYSYTNGSSVEPWDMKPELCLPITNHFEETARSGDSIGSVYGSYHCGMSINRI
jgi:leucyl aminopeptidase